MKKIRKYVLSLLVLACLFLCVSIVSSEKTNSKVGLLEALAEGEVNLFDLENVNWNNYTYNSESKSVTTSSKDTMVYIPLKDYTLAKRDALVFEVSISPKNKNNWQVPYISVNNIPVHFRHKIAYAYVGQDTNNTAGVPTLNDDQLYSYKFIVYGRNYEIYLLVGAKSYKLNNSGSLNNENYTFGIGDRGVEGSVFSNFNAYVVKNYLEFAPANLINFDNLDLNGFTYENKNISTLGKDKELFINSVISSLKDKDNIKLADNTTKKISETTLVFETTVSPKSKGGWQVPYVRFTKGDSNLSLHFRNTIGNTYIFDRPSNTSETMIVEKPCEVSADEVEYTVIIEVGGGKIKCYVNSKSKNTLIAELDMPKNSEIYFALGDRGVEGTIFKNTKLYIKDLELFNYIKSLNCEVNKNVEFEGKIRGFKPSVTYIDEVKDNISGASVSLTGLDNQKSGEQTITAKYSTNDQDLICLFKVNVLEKPIKTSILFINETNFGKNFYDQETKEVSLYGDDSRIFVPTLLDNINDGKIKLKDGSEKNINELTFVLKATISPNIIGGWQVPYLVFYKNGSQIIEYHVRLNLGGAGTPTYIFKKSNETGNFEETVLKQIDLNHYEADVLSYNITLEMTGKNLKLKIEIGDDLLETDCGDILTEGGVPCFGFGDRTNGESIISNMDFYVKDVELDNYAVSMKVDETSDISINVGNELVDCFVNVTYLDGTTEKKGLSDLTVSNFDKTKIGKQDVVLNYNSINSTLSTILKVTVEDVISSYNISLDKLEYQNGENIELSNIKIKSVWMSGKEEDEVLDSKELKILNYDAKTAGEQTIKITYKGVEKEFKISIAEVEKKSGCGGQINISLFGFAIIVAFLSIIKNKKICTI